MSIQLIPSSKVYDEFPGDVDAEIRMVASSGQGYAGRSAPSLSMRGYSTPTKVTSFSRQFVNMPVTAAPPSPDVQRALSSPIRRVDSSLFSPVQSTAGRISSAYRGTRTPARGGSDASYFVSSPQPSETIQRALNSPIRYVGQRPAIADDAYSGTYLPVPPRIELEVTTPPASPAVRRALASTIRHVNDFVSPEPLAKRSTLVRGLFADNSFAAEAPPAEPTLASAGSLIPNRSLKSKLPGSTNQLLSGGAATSALLSGSTQSVLDSSIAAPSDQHATTTATASSLPSRPQQSAQTSLGATVKPAVLRSTLGQQSKHVALQSEAPFSPLPASEEAGNYSFTDEDFDRGSLAPLSS
eukprot:TRINITY_DN7631_c0_g1_i2.p1 TRINITY_DN7631_c0_g1~~TRINITY_DN7631_c0_g1_i2.p1  ORF type:complete len:388 (+),score=52.78 TRINITY_DN7631_c0_g1_i2:102-1166(+)